MLLSYVGMCYLSKMSGWQIHIHKVIEASPLFRSRVSGHVLVVFGRAAKCQANHNGHCKQFSSNCIKSNTHI